MTCGQRFTYGNTKARQTHARTHAPALHATSFSPVFSPAAFINKIKLRDRSKSKRARRSHTLHYLYIRRTNNSQLAANPRSKTEDEEPDRIGRSENIPIPRSRSSLAAHTWILAYAAPELQHQQPAADVSDYCVSITKNCCLNKRDGGFQLDSNIFQPKIRSRQITLPPYQRQAMCVCVRNEKCIGLFLEIRFRTTKP